MASPSPYLQEQFGDTERLQARIRAHKEFSEKPDTWSADLVAALRLGPGMRLLDAGCGDGGMHAALADAGASIVGIDQSLGMAHAAQARGTGACGVGDVQALPFADAVFERVLAAHVLFFVPDVMRALAELRRVLRSGGRVVMTTNMPRTMQALVDLHVEAARSLGLEPSRGPGATFTTDDLPLVQSVFPGATVRVMDDAFVFPHVKPALEFYASGMIDRIADRPADNSHRPQLLALLRPRIEAVVARDGVFRVAKGSGLFEADVR